MKHLKIKELFASDLVAMNIPEMVLIGQEKKIFCSGTRKGAPFSHKKGLSSVTSSLDYAPASCNQGLANVWYPGRQNTAKPGYSGRSFRAVVSNKLA